MAYKVLVVDDSTFFRRRVKEILEQEPSLTVVGDARNGKEAVEQARKLDPDVVTMDIEMPVMDGISAVKKIMAENPLPILMFSSLSHEGAQATLDALDAGALDFLPKKFEDIAQDREDAKRLLQARVKALGYRKFGLRLRGKKTEPVIPGKTAATKKFFRSATLASTPSHEVKEPRLPHGKLNKASGKSYKLLAIGTSTGGPVALHRILSELPANFPTPILLVQHMPGTFTTAFAKRLDNACAISVKEAADGDVLQPGTAYLAPGGRQMVLEGNAAKTKIRITDVSGSQPVTYKPSVDITFSSISKIFAGDVLALILTGMGADGREGCRELQGKGATIWAQDEKSSVVYGMPQAVTVANLASRNIALDDVADSIKTELRVTS